MVADVNELNDLPIKSEAGRSIYLRDIGQARDSSAIQTSRVRIDGKRQVYVPIYRQQGASSLDVTKGVRDHIPFMESRLPPGTKLDLVMDQSVYVSESINSLRHEGLIGAALVSLMILIFLGNWRMTLIASLSIPLALIGAIIGLWVVPTTPAMTINVMTLAGLALAIGPLVDDAIVELENNHRNYCLGKSRIRAALDGCAEVMVPVMVATFTTCIVLAPIALMPGMGGFLFKPLALAVTFAMFVSFFLSRTFVPMMCAKFLPDDHTHLPHAPRGFFAELHHRFDWFLDRKVTHGYARLLAWALRHRVLVLGTVAGLFAGALFLGSRLGREFFPPVDAGQITIYLRTSSNLRLDAAERRVAEVEDFINKNIPASDREMVITELGLNPDWSAAYTANSGQQDAVVRIQLKERRKKSAQEYAILLRHAFAREPRFNDLRLSFDTGGMVSAALNMGASSPIDVQVSGGDSKRDYRDAYQIARKVRDAILDVRGAEDVRILQRRDAPYLVIDVDRQKAASVGLSAEDVILQVVAAMNSSVTISRNFWIDTKSGNQYFVGVQYPEEENMTVEDVLNVFATGTNQPNTVKLGSLATLRRASGDVEINHTALARTFNVLVNTENRDVAGVAGDALKRLKAIQKDAWKLALAEARARAEDKAQPLPRREKAIRAAQELEQDHAKLREEQNPSPLEWLRRRLSPREEDLRFPHGIRVQLKGEYARMNESSWNLLGGLGMAAILVYLLQVALFRSWAGPFVIMFTVPLGLIGVLTMLYVTNTTLNVQSQMGVIFLVGIAVNNGVLLVDFANKQRRAGSTVAQAIQAAASIRLRPILMTFLATFLDLIPMAFPNWFGLPRGGEATIPLARAVVGGLLTSTALTLFVVPIMFTLLMKDPLPPEVDIEAELAKGPVPPPALPTVEEVSQQPTPFV
jgi:multidrug efflux pump subunit AcrB